jgi:hypothetical protein
MRRTVSDMEKSFSHILLMGDFNFLKIDWPAWSASDEEGTSFLECVKDCYFSQCVDKFTRCRINPEPSLLDLIIVNDESLIDYIEHLDPLGRSDHCFFAL